ncbi:MAG: PEGA domain-containing protein, partial [Patescibacteria group bacterium]
MQHATRNTQKVFASKFELLSLVTCLLLLVTLLSACTVIGTNKPAALQITSTPEASVFLDGKHIGKTPYSSDQLRAREYLVKIAAGEATYVEKVSLREGTLTVINRELNNNFLAQSGEVLWLESGK